MKDIRQYGSIILFLTKFIELGNDNKVSTKKPNANFI